jgi:cytochrome c556
MKSVRKWGVPLALVMGCLGISGVSVEALGVGPDPVKARNDAMEDAGRAFKAMSAIAKKQAKFDAAVVKKNADLVAEKLKAASTLFPPGSEKGSVKSLARPEVWSDAAGFDAGMKASISAVAGLQAVSEEAAFLPAFKAVGESCKSCHEKYRVPKN